MLMYIGLGIISTLVYLFILKRQNRQRDEGRADEAIGGERLEPGQTNAEGKGKGGWYATVAEAVSEAPSTFTTEETDRIRSAESRQGRSLFRL